MKTAAKLSGATTRWLVLIVCAVGSIGLAFALYGYATRLPLFWDDVRHFEWLKLASLHDIWSAPRTGENYYRPMAFTVWKAMGYLWGGLDSAALHGLNIVAHGLNAMLVGLIARNQGAGRGDLVGLAAGAVFLTFPFGFQAIVPINSLGHPLHVLFALGAVACVQSAISKPSWALSFGAGVLAAGAVLSHDNGFITPALLLLAGLLHPDRPGFRRLARAWLPGVAIWLPAAAIWLLMRRLGSGGGADGLGQSGGDVFSLAYFAQALSFPGALLAARLNGASVTPDAMLTLGICLGAAALWFGLAAVGRAKRIAAFGLGWWVLATLPSWLFLDPSYALQSPRLTYLAAVGVACFVAAPVVGLATGARLHRAAGLCGVMGVAASALWGVAYLQPRAGLYAMLGDSIRQLGARVVDGNGCALEPRVGVAAINFPAWFFLHQPEYALGYDGITLVSGDSSLGHLLALNFGSDPEVAPVVLPDAQTAGAPYVGLGPGQTLDSLDPVLRSSRAVVLTTVSKPGGIRVAMVGCLRSAGVNPVVDRLARIGPIDLLQATARRGDGLELILDLRFAGALADDATVFVHAVDAGGALIGQADGYPLGGLSPPRLWRAGDVWRDARRITLAPDVLARAATVQVGMYLTGNGTRLMATDPAGARLPDDAYSILVK